MKLHENYLKGNDRIAESEKIINIELEHALHNEAIRQCFKFDLTRTLFIPNWCYKKILKPNGFADEIGIHILAELMALQQLYGSDGVDFELKGSFTHFWEKFLFRIPQIQRASYRLESSGLVSRLFYKTNKLWDSEFSKEMTLKLNNTQVERLMEQEDEVML